MPTAFNDASTERSKSFLKALQELKNLKPQLYSAAEYCEKSYIYNDQKQMVLDSVKDYSVKALVNAVDHLGTVAHKLTEVFEQQSSNIDTLDLKITCLDQKLQMCQSYIDNEGLRLQQLSVATSEHHKHYVLLEPLKKREHIRRKMIEVVSEDVPSKPHSGNPGVQPTKTLLWHLASASEAKSDSKNASILSTSTEDNIGSAISPGSFCLSDAEAAVSPSTPSMRSGYSSDTGTAVHARRSSREIYKMLTAYESFKHGGHRPSNRSFDRSKSMLSAVLGKSKSKFGHPPSQAAHI